MYCELMTMVVDVSLFMFDVITIKFVVALIDDNRLFMNHLVTRSSQIFVCESSPSKLTPGFSSVVLNLVVVN
jgi:hypothetical protein